MMRAVERIVAIFESFVPEKNSLCLQEISERIHLPKSTTFRLVQSLEQAGYLVRLEDQQYCLSFRFLRLAGVVRSTLDVRLIARPIMVELAQKTKETVTLNTVNGMHRACVDAVATESRLRCVVQPGEQVPLMSGSSSKILVAHLPKQNLAAMVTQIAGATGRSQQDMIADLAAIREQGYAISHGEYALGQSGVAAPIMGTDDTGRYCLTVVGPTVRMQPNEQDIVRDVIKAAADISRRYGGPAGSLRSESDADNERD